MWVYTLCREKNSGCVRRLKCYGITHIIPFLFCFVLLFNVSVGKIKGINTSMFLAVVPGTEGAHMTLVIFSFVLVCIC